MTLQIITELPNPHIDKKLKIRKFICLSSFDLLVTCLPINPIEKINIGISVSSVELCLKKPWLLPSLKMFLKLYKLRSSRSVLIFIHAFRYCKGTRSGKLCVYAWVVIKKTQANVADVTPACPYTP
jgi:hypothetical protein